MRKAGSLYWFGTREETGVFRDGGRLQADGADAGSGETVLVRHDLRSAQSQRNSDRPRQAALRSLFESTGKTGSSVELYFGPTAPAGHEGEWIKAIPGKGRFVYFRILRPPRRPSSMDAGSRGISSW